MDMFKKKNTKLISLLFKLFEEEGNIGILKFDVRIFRTNVINEHHAGENFEIDKKERRVYIQSGNTCANIKWSRLNKLSSEKE